MYGNRFFKTTLGVDAEIFVGKAVAYTDDTTLKDFAANAVEGELAIINATTNAVVTSAPAAGTKLFVALKRDGRVERSAPFPFSTTVSDRQAYIAPVKHVITVSDAAVNASLVDGGTDITYYAKVAGTAGNSLQVEYIDSALNNVALTVTATATKVTVNLATDGSSAPTSTKTLIAAAVNASADASAIVKAVVTGTGSDVGAAMSATNLAGGTGTETAVVKGDLLDIVLIETTAGLEPLPRWEYSVEVKANETYDTALARLIAKINNPVAPENQGKTRIVDAALVNAATNNDFTLSARDFNSHFTVALRGKLADSSSFAVTTQFKFGLGAYPEVVLMEANGDIRKGVTTNYPSQNAVPAEFGAPSQFALSTNTYNIFRVVYTAEDKSRTLDSIFRKNYIFIVVPASGGPDAAIDAIL